MSEIKKLKNALILEFEENGERIVSLSREFRQSDDLLKLCRCSDQLSELQRRNQAISEELRGIWD